MTTATTQAPPINWTPNPESPRIWESDCGYRIFRQEPGTTVEGHRIPHRGQPCFHLLGNGNRIYDWTKKNATLEAAQQEAIEDRLGSTLEVAAYLYHHFPELADVDLHKRVIESNLWHLDPPTGWWEDGYEEEVTAANPYDSMHSVYKNGL